MNLYTNVRKLFGPLIKFIFRVKITGMENLPKDGSVVLYSNHLSNLDPVLLGAVMERQLFFMAKVELFRVPLLRGLIRAFGAFPVNRSRNDIDAIKKALRILRNGNVLAMFPEGKRLRKFGTPRPFKPGAAMLAYRTHSMLLPTAIIRKGKFWPFQKHIIRIGEPITLEEAGFTSGSQDDFKKVSDYMRGKTLSLLEG